MNPPLTLVPGDQLDLRRSEMAIWRLERGMNAVAEVEPLAADGPEVTVGERWFALTPSTSRGSLVLWEPENAEGIAWYLRGRWRGPGRIQLPDVDGEFRLTGRLRGAQQLRDPGGALLATIKCPPTDAASTSIHADIDPEAADPRASAGAVLMAVVVTLVKALGIGPSRRHGPAHDLTWGPREGWWAASFGGDGGLFGDGGGGGDGGGDGGGGNGGGGNGGGGG